MWTLFIKFLVSLFTGVFGEWEKSHEAEKAGGEKVRADVEQQAAQDVAKTVAARDRVDHDIVVHPDSLRDGSDPNQRD